MKKKETEADWFVAQEAELAAALPPGFAKPWETARACKFVLPADRNADMKRSRGRKRKPVGRWAPAHAYMVLTSMVAILDAASGLVPPCTSPAELFQPDQFDRLLKKGFSHLSGTTKSILLHNAYSFAQRVLGIKAPWLLRAANLIQQREPRKDHRDRRRSYDIYVSTALDLAPKMLPGEAHDVETALEARHAASFGIAAEAATRRSELSGLEMRDIIIDTITRRVTVKIRAEISKSGRKQSLRLSKAMSEVVIDYHDNARPVLAAKSGISPASNAFWLTQTGTPLGQAGLAAALRKNARHYLGVTVSCNIFRQAMASRVDILESDAGAHLGHSRLSKLANELYAERDRRPGQLWIQNAWKTIREKGHL